MRFWLATLATLVTFGFAGPSFGAAREATVSAQSLREPGTTLDGHVDRAATLPSPRPRLHPLASLVAAMPAAIELIPPRARRAPAPQPRLRALVLRAPARPSARAPPLV